jgi:hypothetical protein
MVLILQLLKSNNIVAFCKKIWHHSDAGDWVRFYFSSLFMLDFTVGNNQKPVLPEKLAVVCNDMKGIYFSTLIL